MPSVKTVWKRRGLIWRYRRQLWKYRKVWAHRGRILLAVAGAGVGAFGVHRALRDRG